jgi:arylsulfatase
MNFEMRVPRLKQCLDHPLSPAPLIVVFVGYWMPLEWMLNGEALTTNFSLLERLHVAMAMVLVNCLLFSLLGTIGVYALAGLFSLLPKVHFQSAADWGLRFLTSLIFLGVTVRAIKLMMLGSSATVFWFKALAILATLLGSLWLTRTKFSVMKWLLVPRYLTAVMIPFAAILFVQELGWGVHPFPHDNIIHDARANASGSPDIILITVDTFAAGHLHSYGYQRATSPHLDAFSTESIQFDNSYANANWTRPGVASILDGSRPWTHRGDLGRPLSSVTKTQNLLNLAANAGYEIRMVSSNPWADLEWQGITSVPKRRVIIHALGDSHFDWMQCFRIARPSFYFSNLIGLRNLFTSLFGSQHLKQKTEEYLPSSEEVLRDAPSDRPLLFWLHIVSAHGPYATPSPYIGTFEPSPLARTLNTSHPPFLFHKAIEPERERVLVGRYDEAVLMSDDIVGGLLDLLKKQGRFDRSLIVVTADHGESFHPRYGGHGGPVLSEEIIHIPLFLKPPYYRGSKRETTLFEQADITPTILSYARLPIPADMEGQSYLTKPANVPAFSMNRDLQSGALPTLSVAVREGDWKYVYHWGKWNHPWPKKELYNIALDPAEQNNLADREPERADAMHKQIVAELFKHRLSTKEFEK